MSYSNDVNNNSNNSIRNCVLGTAAVIGGWEGQTYIQKGLGKYTVGKYIRPNMKTVQGGGFKEYVEKALKQHNLDKDIVIYDVNYKNAKEIEEKIGLNHYRKVKTIKRIERLEQDMDKNCKYPYKIRKILKGYNFEKDKINASLDKINKSIEDINNREKFAAQKIQKKSEKILNILIHILRFPNIKNSFEHTVEGKNAFFLTKKNAIVCNFDKFGAPIFHEIAHKLNSRSKNPIIKTLSSIRNRIAIFAPLAISACAVFTNKKANKKDEKLNDKIKNNCGILTTLAMTPLAIEETIANVRGTKIAEKAGVVGEKLAKVKKCHKLSIISYWSAAIIAGLAAWGGNKIRDYIKSGGNGLI